MLKRVVQVSVYLWQGTSRLTYENFFFYPDLFQTDNIGMRK